MQKGMIDDIKRHNFRQDIIVTCLTVSTKETKRKKK